MIFQNIQAMKQSIIDRQISSSLLLFHFISPTYFDSFIVALSMITAETTILMSHRTQEGH